MSHALTLPTCTTNTNSYVSAPTTTAEEHADRLPTESFYGQVLSERFQLSDKVLGSGSFGHAFLCYDKKGKRAALSCIAKVEIVPTESCFDKRDTQLEHEYKIYKHLAQYPKITKYLPKVHLFVQHTVEPHITIPIMVMERAGKDLLTILIDENKPFYQLRTLGQIGVQVVRALKYMHEMFIVHRDLKPQNIMLIVDGPVFQVKLIDFGLSMPIPEQNEKNRQLYRSSTCTLAFASWRQHFRHVCSARTDMESFLYTWAFLAGTPFPWSDAPSETEAGGKTARREMIGRIKCETSPNTIGTIFDSVGRDPLGTNFTDLLVHALNLDCLGRPNYSKFTQYFRWLSNPP